MDFDGLTELLKSLTISEMSHGCVDRAQTGALQKHGLTGRLTP